MAGGRRSPLVRLDLTEPVFDEELGTAKDL